MSAEGSQIFGSCLVFDEEPSRAFKEKLKYSYYLKPAGIRVLKSIAAVIGNKTAPLSTQVLGDTLVHVKSALGQHKNPKKNLDFKKENIWISYDSNHLDLLNNLKILDKLKVWLV